MGGSQLVAVELCEYLTKRGHQVTVIAANGPLSERVLACGAQHLNWPVGKKRLSTLKLIKPIRRWLNEQQPDIVHVHSRLPAWIAYQALKKLEQRPAFITSMHGHYSVNAYSAVMAKGDRVIAVSDHMRNYTLEQYPKTPSKRVVTIHGGASDADFPYQHQPDQHWLPAIYQQFPALENKTWLMLPGRVTRWKGHLAFLQLIARLKNQDQSIHGLIIGPYRTSSGYYRELQNTIVQLGLQSHITLTGSRDDMPNWYVSSRIVYNLSDNPPEAFGRTVLEALKIGTPVLAWNQGGPAEQLAHFYPEGKVLLNNLDDLEQKSVALLKEPELVPQKAGFSLTDAMQLTEQVYEQAQLQINTCKT